jgi:hypothetical protein
MPDLDEFEQLMNDESMSLAKQYPILVVIPVVFS